MELVGTGVVGAVEVTYYTTSARVCGNVRTVERPLYSQPTLFGGTTMAAIPERGKAASRVMSPLPLPPLDRHPEEDQEDSLAGASVPRCPCCEGTGVVSTERPLCGCAILQRDGRPVEQHRRAASLQALALRRMAYGRDGELLPVIVEDWRRADDERHYPVSDHPMDRPPAADLFDADDELCSWLVQHVDVASDAELLDRAQQCDREAGRGALVAGLDAASQILGGLPDVLADLRTALAAEVRAA